MEHSPETHTSLTQLRSPVLKLNQKLNQMQRLHAHAQVSNGRRDIAVLKAWMTNIVWDMPYEYKGKVRQATHIETSSRLDEDIQTAYKDPTVVAISHEFHELMYRDITGAPPPARNR